MQMSRLDSARKCLTGRAGTKTKCFTKGSSVQQSESEMAMVGIIRYWRQVKVDESEAEVEIAMMLPRQTTVATLELSIACAKPNSFFVIATLPSSQRWRSNPRQIRRSTDRRQRLSSCDCTIDPMAFTHPTNSRQCRRHPGCNNRVCKFTPGPRVRLPN